MSRRAAIQWLDLRILVFTAPTLSSLSARVAEERHRRSDHRSRRTVNHPLRAGSFGQVGASSPSTTEADYPGSSPSGVELDQKRHLGSVVDPLGNVLGIMYNPYFFDTLAARSA
jgi:hypothetical protein